MLKFATVFLIMTTALWAQDAQTPEQVTLKMCGRLDHRYDELSHECIYCAHGFLFDNKTATCKGTPDVIGKCNANDHYHAATNECMYCVVGYVFDEKLRGYQKKK